MSQVLCPDTHVLQSLSTSGQSTVRMQWSNSKSCDHHTQSGSQKQRKAQSSFFEKQKWIVGSMKFLGMAILYCTWTQDSSYEIHLNPLAPPCNLTLKEINQIWLWKAIEFCHCILYNRLFSWGSFTSFQRTLNLPGNAVAAARVIVLRTVEVCKAPSISFSRPIVGEKPASVCVDAESMAVHFTFKGLEIFKGSP